MKLEDFVHRAANFQRFPNQLNFRSNSDHPNFQLVVSFLHR
jgi:hypothetical protein